MKQLILIIIFFTPFVLKAYSCPRYLGTNQKAREVHTWLKKLSAQTELHGCKIEIVSCEEGEKNNETAPIGEVLIQTEDGREAYLSFDFPSNDISKFTTLVRSRKNSLYYEKKDRYYEEINGRTEVWRCFCF